MPRVEIHLSGHGELDTPNLPESIFRIHQTLAKTQGTVYVFLENAVLPQSIAHRLESLIASGEKPASAFFLYNFLTDDRLPGFIRHGLGKQLLEMLLTLRSTRGYSAHELRALDVLHQQHRDPQTGQPRLRVLFEHKAEGSDNLTPTEYTALQNVSLELLKSADFDGALAVFKSYTTRMAALTAARESLIAERVAEVASHPETAAIFIRFGLHHSGLYPAIQTRLPNADLQKLYFATSTPQRGLHFDPETSAIRKIMFRGPDSLSELEWYRAMLGACILNVLKLLESLEPTGLSAQEMVVLSSQLAQFFQSAEAVEEFRKAVAETEIMTALQNSGLSG